MIRQIASRLYVIDQDSHISKWVEEKGQLQHDFQTLPLILPLIKEGDVVVDAGANIGDTAGPFLERVGPSGKVHAFEPNPDAFECLAKNCPNALCHEVALSDRPMQLPLERCKNAGASRVINFTDESSRDVTLVQAVTLDSFNLEKLDFLKIDVEGFEMNVLIGGYQTINRCKPIMLIEINDAALRRQKRTPLDVLEWLHFHKYRWWPVVGADLNQGSPQYDVLARPIS